MSANKPLPSKEGIKVWIKRNGGREKIGKLIGSEKSTIDSWFSSRGIPKDKHEAIARLMAASAASYTEPLSNDDYASMIRVPFSGSLLRDTHKAANLVGEEFHPYCEKAIEARVIEWFEKRAHFSLCDLPN